MHPVAYRLTASVTVAFLLTGRAAHGDTPDPADTLFRQGRASADAGDYARACVAFGESLKLDPAPGTLLNLADCEEHMGRVASAWGHFLRVESVLPATDERRDIAHGRAAMLAPRVPWMTITLAPDTPRDARVFRDDVEMAGARLAVPLPVDPGPHSVLVVAPSREAKTFTVAAVERETTRVVASTGDPIGPHDVSRPEPSSHAASHAAPWLLGAAGVVSLGIGTYFGSRALVERSWSDASCTGGVCSNAAALGEYDSARSDARASDVALGIGIVALGVGGYLLLVSGREAHAANTTGGPVAGSAVQVTAGGMGCAW
jgi:hypothetical protein